MNWFKGRMCIAVCFILLISCVVVQGVLIHKLDLEREIEAKENTVLFNSIFSMYLSAVGELEQVYADEALIENKCD